MKPVCLLLALGGLGFVASGCPTEDDGNGGTGLHRVSIAATPSRAEVNGNPITISVTVLRPDNSPLPSGSTVDIIELACVDSNQTSVGLFDSQQDGNCGTTTRTVTGTTGAVNVTFRCLTPGTTTLLAAPTGVNDPPGQTDVTCDAGPTGQWSVTTITKVEGLLETGSNEVEIEASAVQDDGETAVPANTPLKLTIEDGDSLTIQGGPVAQTNAEGKATFKVLTNEKEGESVLLVEFDDPRFGSGASESFRVRPPSDTRDSVLEVTVRRDNLVVDGSERTVLANDEDQLTIEAELILPGGAEFSGEGQPVTFKLVSGPGFFDNPGTTEAVLPTDNTNKSLTDFIGGDTPGTAIIEVSVVDPNPDLEEERILTQMITINVNSLGFIEFVGNSPNVLYVRGSGQNETSLVTFRVLDTNNQPLEGVPVAMDLPDNPLGGVTLTEALPQSNAEGFVSTTIVSGRSTGAVNVTATAVLGSVVLEAPSASIPIVGARTTRNAFNLRCDFLNIGGFIGRQGDQIIVNDQYACSSTLFDRFNNPVGIAQSITYLSEGGNIISPQLSVPWDTSSSPNSPPDNVGRVAAPYSPEGNPPCDVDPDERLGEPFLLFDQDSCGSIQNNCPRRDLSECSANPRDGLVTIVAITTGEEAFNDFNNNGDYDAGEPFWDLGEPFLDTNDNNEFDEGETFRDLANEDDPEGNSEYDGPNGAWDSNTTIWTSTKVLLTGRPAALATNIPSDPLQSSGFIFDAADRTTPIDLRTRYEVDGDTVTIGIRWQDANLNVLNDSATFSGELIGDNTGLRLSTISTVNPDLGMGFNVEFLQEVIDEDEGINGYLTRLSNLGRNFFEFVVTVEVTAENHNDSPTLRFNASYQITPGIGPRDTTSVDIPLRFVPRE